MSVNINNKFDLVGIWACKPYIEEYYMYQCINIDKYNIKTIIIGYFNSNEIWDSEHCDRSHGIVVKELSRIGLFSAYHFEYNEEQGKETRGTFYLYRHLDRPYHIDGWFIDKNKIAHFEIVNNKNWLILSDHIPILLETKM